MPKTAAATATARAAKPKLTPEAALNSGGKVALAVGLGPPVLAPEVWLGPAV